MACASSGAQSVAARNDFSKSNQVNFYRKIARDTPKFRGIAGDFYAKLHAIDLLCVAPGMRYDYRRMGRRQGILLHLGFLRLITLCLLCSTA